MKSILEGRKQLKAVVYQIAEVTGYLWQKGWAERNGGNITVNVTEFMDDECKAMPAISEVKPIGMVLPQLKGKYFYCKGTGKRMRDLAREPMQNGSIIRILDDGQPYIYGSPWSGKTPCYRNRRARLGAVTRIDRAPQNSIERLKPIQAFASLLPACSSMKWDPAIYRNLCDAVTRVIETTPVYTLHCLPDEEAARVCCAALTEK